MSLSTLLKNQDVIDRFRQEFKCPKLNVQNKLLAPPVTKRYSLVGTAFDYLLRFHIKRINPKATTKPWIAEIGGALLQAEILMSSGAAKYKIINGKIEREIADDGRLKIADEIVKEAKKSYFNFLKDGKLNDKLFKSVLLLAQLDTVYRTSRPDPNLGIIDKKDVADLTNIISLVEARLFKAKKVCLLNPTFGKASDLVGGADADLVIDDTLIDIKTTKYLRLIRRDFNQIVGYYCLYKIGGINGSPAENDIKKIGIYFSRFGYLHIMDIDDFIDQENFSEFLVWFKRRAEEEQKLRAQRQLEFKRRREKDMQQQLKRQS